ncbi:MAG TPA: hypothetical protein VEK37_00265 [Gemmatimonadaceae bacterium]|nr:hypothetical protein [Gemmatimonadaceae bacterium]
MWKLSSLIVAGCFGLVGILAAQGTPRSADLRGTWELVSTKDLKSGTVTPAPRTEWMQFTRTHFSVTAMSPGRKTVASAQYDSLSPEGKVKVDYSRVFDDKGNQVFAARAGTWRLVGNQLHQTASMAIFAQIIGIDRSLKITKLSKTSLVVEAPGFTSPDLLTELTYRRID